MPAADPRPGLDHAFEPVSVPVAISFPEDGRGRELAPPAIDEQPAPVSANRQPPLLNLDPPPASRGTALLLGALQYRALRLSAPGRAGARARRRGGAPGDLPSAARAREARLPLTPPTPGPTVRVRKRGAPPARVERPQRFAEPGDERCARGAAGVRGPEPARPRRCERASARRTAAWTRPCARSSRVGAEIRPEQPFLLPLGDTLIRGSIDLFATMPSGEPLVVDFKTDRLGDESPASHLERYEVQRTIYALAAAARGDPVRTAYLFLEGDHAPEEKAFGEGELAEARELIDGLLRRHRRAALRRHRHARTPPSARLPRARAALQPQERGPDAR